MTGKSFFKSFFLAISFVLCSFITTYSAPVFKAIMWSVNDPWHFFMNSAKTYIQQLGTQYNFQADYSEDLTKQTDSVLSQYQMYINLNIEVTPLNTQQKKAFENFINAGKAWVGFHMAGNNKQNWDWYDTFLGGCRFTGHPEIQKATINVEDSVHLASKELPHPKWQIADEFYEFDKSPRPNVRVLASLDEKTYRPAKAMGDHPYVWCNERYPHTIYIGLGHLDSMWTKVKPFRDLVRDAILWAGGINKETPAIRLQQTAAPRTCLTVHVGPGSIFVSLPEKRFNAVVTNAMGRTVASGTAINGKCSFDRSALPHGACFIKASWNNGSIVERTVFPY